jgi:pimeloyl-ACP methyl ester carboxylesterase
LSVIPSLHDSLPIAYESHGSGDTALVLVHGWSCDRRYWRKQREPFSPFFRIVGIDLAGHGDSGIGREGWTIASFGTDVASVVEALRLDRVVLVGHSMGGDVILEAARRLPGRVLGLVWVDVYRSIRTPRTPEQIRTLQAPFREDFVEATRAFVRSMFPKGSDPRLVEWVAEDMSAAPPEIALPAMEAAMSFDREIPAALAELKLPIVAITPDDPPGDIPSMRRHGIEVVSMSEVGHFPMLEDPGRFNALLRGVVDRFLAGSTHSSVRDLTPGFRRP